MSNLAEAYKAEFSSFDEALGNPSTSRARLNPGKGFETIRKATFESGGWRHQRGSRHGRPVYTYCILSGPYTGTYTAYVLPGKTVIRYTPRLSVGLTARRHNVGLILWARKKILATLSPLISVYNEAVKKSSPVRPEFPSSTDLPEFPSSTAEPEPLGTRPGKEELRRNLVAYKLERWIIEARNQEGWPEWWWEEEEEDDDEWAYPRSNEEYLAYRERERARQERKSGKIIAESSKKDVAAAESLVDTDYIEAIPPGVHNLYVMIQASGIPLEKVISDLKEKPKRILSLVEATGVVIPTRYRERKQYSKVFLQTWSPKAAFDAITKSVEGSAYGYASSGVRKSAAQYMRDTFGGVPSWKQVAVRAWMDVEGVKEPSSSPTLKASKEDIVQAVERLTDLQEWLESLGVRSTEFRELLKKGKTAAWLSNLKDTIDMAQVAGPVLAETVEGRRVLDAIHQRNWVKVHGYHDQVMQAERTMQIRLAEERAERDRLGLAEDESPVAERATKHKALARQFVLPEGVKPLVTANDFRQEGADLEHCVSAYHLNGTSFEFRFHAPDDTRATLELGVDGMVRQFRGPRNGTPSPATQQMLRNFLDLNKDNIALMRKRKFPVRPEEAQENGRLRPYRSW